MGRKGTPVLTVARKEKKFMVSLEDRLYLLNALDKLLIPDSYGDYNGYRVRSVYFDGICNNDYWDKVNGAIEKKRIRLRIYDTSDTKAKFEVKRKVYDHQLKESVTISSGDAKELLKGNYSVLLNYDSPVAEYGYGLMCAQCYRPVSLIEYHRRAYTHPNFNTRVTLDNHLRFCDSSFDIFSNNINFKEVLSPDKSILEIKYDRFLFEQLQEVFKRCDLSMKPPSKFGSSRKILKQYYC
ncbi:polyphosphate polymerase domain-containing protein [Clostridium polynesiense]|uniref:polyphosphate polymerase domain-containing protein n=1 Tax=Clostridium polynesiense TaxID=1325933 RepID=UPI00058FE489|nr:polyphosphate polymerase domain-containing protein [Clostridium polynesiense]